MEFSVMWPVSVMNNNSQWDHYHKQAFGVFSYLTVDPKTVQLSFLKYSIPSPACDSIIKEGYKYRSDHDT